MPRLTVESVAQLRALEAGAATRTLTLHAWDSFSNFALRDNVLEVAVGLIVAASFTACANSLVSDILLPIIALLPFLSRNLGENFAVLQRGPAYNGSISAGYNTVKQALDDGAVVLAYGAFLDKVMRFLLVAAVLWIVAVTYSRGTGDDVVKRQMKCRYCKRYVSEKAKRCLYCTSWFDGREEGGKPTVVEQEDE